MKTYFKHTGISAITYALRTEIRRKRNFRNMRHAPSVLFIWIPKNAGTSIFESLHNFIGMEKFKHPDSMNAFPNAGAATFGHNDYLSLRRTGIVSDNYHESCYKFCIKRNPYTRATSLHNYLTKGKNAPQLCLDAFLDKLMIYPAHPGMYNVQGFSQAAPQSAWIFDNSGTQIPDQIFQFEKLDECISLLSERVNVDIQLGHTNASSKKHTPPLSREQIDKINTIYRQDFINLKYEMK